MQTRWHASSRSSLRYSRSATDAIERLSRFGTTGTGIAEDTSDEVAGQLSDMVAESISARQGRYRREGTASDEVAGQLSNMVAETISPTRAAATWSLDKYWIEANVR